MREPTSKPKPLRRPRPRAARAGGAAPSGDAALVRRVRYRLLAWSGGTTLVALVILGSLLYATVAWSLRTTGEQQLRTRAMDIAQGVQAGVGVGFDGGPGGPVVTGGGMVAGPILVERAEQPGLVIGGETSGTIGFVSSIEGGIIEEDGVPPQLEALLALRRAVTDAVASGEETFVATDVRGTPVRLYVLPVTDAGGDQLIIQVLGDRTAETQTLTVLLVVLAAGGLLVLAAALGVGWIYAERALIPIREALRRQREFAADASHELRTPLAVVRGSVEDLRRNAHQPVATVGHALDDIDAEVGRLTALVDDLLLLARTDSGAIELARQATDLAEIALDASETLVPAADRAGVSIVVDALPSPLVADPGRLRQLVTILLDNAVRHAPPGSKVDVGVSDADGSARLRVEDRGPGFRPEDLPRAFDRFWRALDAPPGGTGLGLSIAAWIAERHGGTITASNRPGGGARLEVILPRS